MTQPADTIDTSGAAAPAKTLEVRPGVQRDARGWITDWRPEDATFWSTTGRAVARRNLNWSIFAEFLGFIVWQLWSIVVVQLPAAGFDVSIGQQLTLVSVVALTGATLRFPYTFMVGRFGGRNWTIASALLLLLPTVGLALAVSDPTTSYGTLLFVAALAGFGGGNFASSMANITYFYPAKEKGWALGLNAAGGNLGAAVSQLVTPVVISLLAFGAAAMNLPMAGWFWVPFILLAAWGAWRNMDNLTTAKSDVAGSLSALREPHLWVMALLYIGTFGSFIGFAGTFPTLLASTFPQYSGFQIASATAPLAFLGALVGSLARPYGGRLADRVGGARMTVIAFVAMAVGALAAVLTLPLENFWVFLGCFLFLFVATGVGNGSAYRMIPAIFAARSGVNDDHGSDLGISTGRRASAALGIIAGIGAYGGFFIPQVLRVANESTGSYDLAFFAFAAVYVAFAIITWGVYARRTSAMGRAGV